MLYPDAPMHCDWYIFRPLIEICIFIVSIDKFPFIISMSQLKKPRTSVTLAKQERENADPLWNIENQQLETEAEANSRLRQQITKQSYADSSVQAEIKDKVNQLKENAVKLAQKLEGEKRKNIELSAIIKHMVYMREEDRKIETEHRDDINFKNVDNLLRKIKKLEYDLEQMFSKLNELTSKNKERKSEVDTFRTQRVIDSGIFLKIEKEIIQHETEYKKLLIEKTKYEREYSKNLQKYKKMKANIEKEPNNKKESEKDQSQDQFFINLPDIEHAVKFTDVSPSENKKLSYSFSRKTLTNIQDVKKQQQQEVQLAIKKIFMETGLNSADTLIDYLKNIDHINEELFRTVNRDTDRISELKEELSELKIKKAEKTIKYYEKEPELTKAQLKMREAKLIESEIERVEKLAKQETSRLNQLIKSNNLRIIASTVDPSLLKDLEIENLENFFATIEEEMNDMISHYSAFKKDLVTQPDITNRDNENREETVEELIGKIKKMEESQKIMVREDFQKEYRMARGEVDNVKRRNNKKKTTLIKRN